MMPPAPGNLRNLLSIRLALCVLFAHSARAQGSGGDEDCAALVGGVASELDRACCATSDCNSKTTVRAKKTKTPTP